MADQVAHLLIDDDAYDLVDYGSVTDVTYDSTNKKLTQTAGITTSDIVTVATLKTDMSLKKADVGLGNVDNKSSATIRGEITSANVTNALGYTPYNSTNPNGYTSNIGTVTGVKINGTTKSPTSGIVDIGTVITDVSTLAPKASPAFTGKPTAPTAASGTNTTQIATTAFVMDAFRANDAMVFKGTIGSSGATVTSLPDTHYDGWTYKVITAGTYAGKVCEIGDMIICVKDGTSASNDDWTVIQTNIDGAVTGPSSSTDAHVAVFNGTSGKVIKDGTYTIGKSVPSNAVFTDTDTKVTSAANHYTPARDTGADKTAAATGGTAAWSIDVVQGVTLQTDGKGHVTGVAVASGKIPADPNRYRPVQVGGTQILSNTSSTALNLVQGSNVQLTNSGGAVTIAATDTTYESKTAASGGTDVSLVTTGEKYIWNSKTSNTGTVTSVETGAGLTGGTITTSGTVKANLTSETKLINAAADGTETAGRVYPVRLDKNSKLAVNVPWENTTYESKAAASGGTDVSLVTTGEKYTWNSKVSCTEANVKNILGVDSTATTTTLFYRKDGTWQTPSGAGIGTVTQVNTGDGLTGGPITGSGTISLDTSGVTEGSYGPSANVTGSDNATMNVPYITVDSYGRVTSIANKVYTSKNTTYSTATTSANGLMSSTDKTKLNGIAEGATANVGTITGITMNGSSKGTSGVVNLGTVITDVSGKADKSATVSTVSYDSTNKKITKTINGSTTDVVTVATLKTAMSLAKGDVGLGNVDNKSSATIRSEITKPNVTNALGFTPPTTGAFTWGDLYMATST